MSVGSSLITVQHKPNAVVIALNKEKILDDQTIALIESQIRYVINDIEKLNLVIDFENVRFLTSSFLGYLIRLSKYIYEKNGQLRLCGIDDKIQGIFKITRLDKIFDIHSDIEKALLSII